MIGHSSAGRAEGANEKFTAVDYTKKKIIIRSKVHINQTRSSYLCCVFAIFFIISLHYWEKWGKKGII